MRQVMVALGADVVPTEGSIPLFCGKSQALLDKALSKIWFAADLRVVNLECPLTNAHTPIEKCGMALSAPTECAAGLSALGLSAVSLANNHILDHGAPGLAATFETLRRASLPYFGAGENAAMADQPCILVANELRIGFWSVAEHEFSCATDDAPGANGLNELTLTDRIRAIKADCDRLVVLYHGGREYYPYPSPRLMARCRGMVESGADAVLCQHNHCVGAMETYLGAPILYGQGNFLFDMDDEPCFETGLVVQLLFTDDETSAKYFPVGRAAHGAKLLKDGDADKVIRGFLARSMEIAEPGFVETCYRTYAAQSKEKLLKVFLGGNPALKAICRLYGRKPTRVYSRAAQLAIQNSLTCESIRELLEAGLNV